MAPATSHAPLHDVGILAEGEHLAAVVRLDQRRVALAEERDEPGRDAPDIGRNAERARAVVDADRDLGRVVRNLHGRDRERADAERPTDLVPLALALDRDSAVDVQRRTERARELVGMTEVIAVLMRGHDAVELGPDLAERNAELRQSARDGARRDPRLDEHTRAAGLDQERVPARPAPEHEDPHGRSHLKPKAELQAGKRPERRPPIFEEVGVWCAPSVSTKPCPRCASPVPLQARFCGQCGHTFSLADATVRTVPTTVDEATADPPPVAAARSAPATVVGHAPMAAPNAPSSEPKARAAPPLGKTMMLGGQGLPDPPPPPAPAPAPVAAPEPVAPTALGSDKRTMLGMPATGLVAPAPAPSAPGGLPSVQKTMLGVAIPGIAPTRDPAPAPAPAPPPDGKGTLLGIAAPGIAPLRAGRAPAPEPAPPPPIVPAPPPLVVEPLPEAPPAKPKKGVPAVVVVGIVFVLVGLVGAGAALFVLRAGAPLTAQPQLDETGKESLRIRCESCPDGTVISLGASSAKIEGAATVLPLPAPLSIGDNDLEMTIDRPAAGRDETVKVHVPVAYRVKADLSTLSAQPPSVTVRVEALPGAEVTVDGKPVALDPAGKAAQAIDVAAETSGPSDEARTIDKKIPFTIKPKGATAAETGQLVVRAGIAPLHLDAPGVELFTDRATGNVSGQVKPGGTVTIDGQNVAVDPAGRFGVRVELPAEGEKSITIVAAAPPLAPRTARAKLVRVASLDAAAKTLDGRSPLGFDAFGADPKAKQGQLVVVEGEIQELRVAQGHSVLLVEDKKCASGSCVVRVIHGEEVRASRGDSVRAYGHIEGTASANGKTIPDIEGALVLAKPAAKAK